ncbi:MAG: hypothetical protein RLZZ536_3632 [Planctomycetota bacterium]|jgi:hypothetical protein
MPADLHSDTPLPQDNGLSLTPLLLLLLLLPPYPDPELKL